MEDFQPIEICLGGPAEDWIPSYDGLYQAHIKPILDQLNFEISFKMPVFGFELPPIPTCVKAGHEQPSTDLVEWFSCVISNGWLAIVDYLISVFADLGIEFPWTNINIGFGIMIPLCKVFDGTIQDELQKPDVIAALRARFPEISTPVSTGKDLGKKLQLLIADAIREQLDRLKNIPALLAQAIADKFFGGLQLIVDAINAILEPFEILFAAITIPTLDQIWGYMLDFGIELSCEGLDTAIGFVTAGAFDLASLGIPCPIDRAEIGKFEFMLAFQTFMANIGTKILEIFIDMWAAIAAYIFPLEIPEACVTIPPPVQIA